ncbi:MAG: polyprenyl synthetase family protein, partial [Bacteroidota bacterium]
MSRLDEIRRPVQREMEAFEQRFKQAMSSKAPLLDKVTHYIVRRKGKQVRPLFVFLSAGLAGGVRESTYVGAVLVELLHTATLVHDDVVDDAHLRRGFFSINALWKNKIAVLVGDYLLSKGLLHALHHREHQLLDLVSDAVRKMSEGELLQMEKARKLDITEEVYFDIISNKTASLMAGCCAVGVASAGADLDWVEKARVFGEQVGLAFQIKDDLLDLGNDPTGKSSGVDLKEKKMTLPLIHALEKAGSGEKRRIMKLVRSDDMNPAKTKEVVRFMHDWGGIDDARNRIWGLRGVAGGLVDACADTACSAWLAEGV